jgi:hypothetical protein
MRFFGMVQPMTCPVLSGPMSEAYRKFWGGDTFFWANALCSGAFGVTSRFYAGDTFK